SPIIVPSQDIVLGLYYVSLMKENEPGEGMIFGSMAEIEQALESGVVTLHSKIRARYHTVDKDNNPIRIIVDATPGRMLLADLLPRHPEVPFDTINQEMTKKAISKAIDVVYRHCGQKTTVIFCDKIMALGFSRACRAGISFGKDDMVIPETKAGIVDATREQVKTYEQQYAEGLITQGEKYNKVVDTWAKCTDTVAEQMMARISARTVNEETGRENPINSIYMMAHSGARGSAAQMKQLAGMRGLMAKPSGEIIETPIISNFKEGLTVMEYFNSTHGARKGLADTALKTANSGYLTRRLVDVAQDSIVTEFDCGTEKGITINSVVDSGEVVSSLAARALGRVPSVDVLNPETGDVVIPAGHEIDEYDLEKIEKAGVEEILIRSALTCETRRGICAKCYGRDLARGTPVNIGEAVGVVAAQSIGEPGTQLTMRTFHIGGAAQVSHQSFVESGHAGTVKIRNANLVKDSKGRLVVMGRNTAVVIMGKGDKELAVHKMSYGSHMLVDSGDTVKRGQQLAEWDPFTRPILTEVNGTVEYEDLVEGVAMNEVVDETTGIAQRHVMDWRSSPRGADLRPALAIRGEDGEIAQLERGGESRYLMSVDAILSVENGVKVQAGDVLARIPTESAKTKDITGGLPRVAELFEARRPKDCAVIAEIDGYIRFGRDYKNKRRISIVPEDETMDPVEYLIPKGKHLHVQEGDYIEKGEYLIEGHPAPHDILAIKGVEELAFYLVKEIQEVYRLQGVTINDKHIEVIVRQMLQKVEITDAGDSAFLNGEQVDRLDFDDENDKVEAAGGRIAQGNPVLLGITKASLQTRSFISAASFQETTRVLTEAAINGKIDKLEGLKENVIVGRLIPAGTGGMLTDMRHIAGKRDQLILEERAKQQAKIDAAQPEVALFADEGAGEAPVAEAETEVEAEVESVEGGEGTGETTPE
ncbi:MAG: DNA-directed RNA polymerase subunit beta', partial [Hyphomicrobiales bacterium]